MKTLTLSDGQKAFVDDEDYIACLQYSWNPHSAGYATAYVGGGRVNQEYILLHTFIARRMDLIGEIDHEDRNKLNCQRLNLRPCTRSQNNINKDVQSNNTSGHKGVSLVLAGQYRSGEYRAYITVKRKQIHLGYFQSIDLAIAARQRAERRYYGDFAS